MIDPRTQYFVYKQQENELMLLIEHKQAARDQGVTTKTSQPWYIKTGQWLQWLLKEKIFSRPQGKRQHIVEESLC